MSPVNNPEPQRYDDEIDLGALFLSLWATRVRVLVAILLVSALFALYIGMNYFTSFKTVRYSNVFSLNFEGLSEGKFPNGSRFQISDLLNNTVLSRVHKQNNLGEQGVTLEEFRRALVVQPYAPNVDLIREKYSKRLADKKLDAAKISDIEADLARELKAARSSSLQLIMTLPQSNALPNHVADKVLLDLANVWADQAIFEKGVLKPELPVYSERVFDNKRLESLDYLLAINLVNDSIKLVRENIQELQGQPNAATLLDEESGYTLADLDLAFRNIADYDIRQLVDPIEEMGISRNENMIEVYYERRLAELQQDKAMWQDRARAVRNVLKSYSDELADGVSSHAAAGVATMGPQLGDAFLDRLLEVSRQGDDMEFRQSLTREILKFENKSIDTDQEIMNTQRTLQAIQSQRVNGVDSTALRQGYIKQVEAELPVLLEQLRDLTRVMNRLYDKQGLLQAGNTGELIAAEGGSYRVSTDKLLNKLQLKLYAVLMFLTFVLSMFGSLLHDWMRGQAEIE